MRGEGERLDEVELGDETVEDDGDVLLLLLLLPLLLDDDDDDGGSQQMNDGRWLRLHETIWSCWRLPRQLPLL